MKMDIINLSKKIGNQEILKDINLQMESGKIYGFYGKNGSGKSMLFRAISGLIIPTSGVVRIDDKKLHKDERFLPDLGIMIENPGFWDYYTGFENLKALASIRKVIGDNEIHEVLKIVDLEHSSNILYKKYSLGMKQRLAIAQAIMESPKVLLLDEPTNALDDQGIEMLRNIVLKMKETGAIVGIASHNKEDIDRLSDIKVKMVEGKLAIVEEVMA